MSVTATRPATLQRQLEEQGDIVIEAWHTDLVGKLFLSM